MTGQLVVAYDTGSEWIPFVAVYDDESAKQAIKALVKRHPWARPVVLTAAELANRRGKLA